MGRPGGLFGASWGPLGGLLGASWGLLGASWGRGLEMSVRVPRLGPLLEPSWGPLGPSWRPLGPSWGPLGPSWGRLGGLLGRLGAILGASWAVLERREAEKARIPRSFKNHRIITDCWLLGPSWQGSWGPLGASWGLLDPSGRHLGRLEIGFRRFWTVMRPLGTLVSCFGARLGPWGALPEAPVPPCPVGPRAPVA